MQIIVATSPLHNDNRELSMETVVMIIIIEYRFLIYERWQM